MSLYNPIRRNLKLRRAIILSCRLSSCATACSFNGRQKLKTYCLSLPYSASDLFFQSLPSRIVPCASNITRTLSNRTADPKSPPEPENNQPKPPTPNEPPSFLRKLSDETQSLVQWLHDFFVYDFPVLLPRVIAFVATIQLSTEYGLLTVSCEGPSMEPTIIDGSHSWVLIERWSHRLFGLEKNDNQAEKQGKQSAVVGGNDLKVSWFALLYGIWQQHFASGLQHGDVIILHHPSKEATICKRIIGKTLFSSCKLKLASHSKSCLSQECLAILLYVMILVMMLVTKSPAIVLCLLDTCGLKATIAIIHWTLAHTDQCPLRW
jgi:hypothetical protein